MVSTQLLRASNRLLYWMINDALPLWSTNAIDKTSGGAVEQLFKNGQPDLLLNKRVRVQARQIFSFSFAKHHGWFDDADSIITDIELFLERNAVNPLHPTVYTHLLSADNQVIDARQDIYDLAFFLLANAWRYRVFQKTQALHKAHRLLQHLDTHFKSRFGGWREGDYDTPFRRQNPHMHLFEALLALYQATYDGKWLARAGEIFTLFESHFFDNKKYILREYFDESWQPVSINGQTIIEPGHMMEWVWLLRRYAELSGSPVEHYANALYQQALIIGTDKRSGLLFDEVTPNGEVIKASKRCWPLTEQIKANIAQAKAGHYQCEVYAAQATNRLFRYFLQTPIAGSYVDRLNVNNQVVDHHAPTSTFYHLISATAEVVSYVNQHSVRFE
ncbi:MAG: AGE family epimerase/isomerase [Spongiibacteraceae bacterium]|nr:AGE family epimerase/isomerase [Spongiibacteraceae bacterium]